MSAAVQHMPRQKLATLDLDTRRMAVGDWLQFVRDFGRLDVGPLIQRAAIDDEFVAAIEAAVASGTTASAAYDALRDFCVQHLYGDERRDDPPRHPYRPLYATDQPRTVRATPYSVPVALLKGIFREFHPGRLRIESAQTTLDVGAQSEERWHRIQNQNRVTLFTGIWGRVFPAPVEPLTGEVALLEAHVNYRWDLALLALVTDYTPLFLPMPPSGSLEVRIRSYAEAPFKLHLFLEGWTHL